MRVCALIMTYNRKSRVEECLKALECQTYKDFDIIICDNNSNGGTSEFINNYLNDRAKHINSGCNNREDGFCYGIQFVYNEGYDWIWVLHDDVLPLPSALEELVASTKSVDTISILTSSIYSKDDRSALDPPISSFAKNGYNFWYQNLDKDMVRLSNSSFVSTLICREAIEKCGLPTKEDSFGENSNYLSRLMEDYAAGFMVCKSKVLHYQDLTPVPEYKICAVVVTYNRKVMLSECLQALKSQFYKHFDILIIDNASTDGTYDFIKGYIGDRVKYFNTGDNLGGAGGFYYGMKIAYEEKYDWFWIMDDDVIPTPTALTELLDPLKFLKNVSFLASSVYSKDGDAMNTPEISRFSTNGYRYWYEFLDRGLVRLSHATFVSLLINRKAVKACGLPCKNYFIWGDDVEYTMRITRKFGAAYMVGKSKVIHARAISSTLSIRAENNPQRIKMFYYMVRNTLLNSRAYFGKKEYHNWLKRYFKDCIKIAIGQRSHRKLKILTICRAIKDYIKGNYDKKAFDNRYRLYGQEKAVLSYFGSEIVVDAVSNIKEYVVNNKGKNFSVFTAFENPPTCLKWELVDNKVVLSIKDEIYKMSLQRYKKTVDPNEFFVFDFIGSCYPIAKFENDEDSIKVNYTDEFAQLNDAAPLKSLEVFDRSFINPRDFSKEEITTYLLKFVFFIEKIYRADKVILVKNHFYSHSLKGGKCEKISAELAKTHARNNKFLDSLYNEYAKRVPECHIVDDLDCRVYQHGSDEFSEESCSADENLQYIRECIEVIASNYKRAKEKKLLRSLRKKYNKLMQSKYGIKLDIQSAEYN